MTDEEIVTLYWERQENAIDETRNKYGHYCYAVAYRIVRSAPDAEECVSDTYLDAWNAMPPHRPTRLQTFLGKLTRNRAIKKCRAQSTQKRGGETERILEELDACVPKGDFSDEVLLKDALNRFLESLPPLKRTIFLRRYWYAYTVREIAEELSLGEGRVKMTLLRLRRQLKEFLERE